MALRPRRREPARAIGVAVRVRAFFATVAIVGAVVAPQTRAADSLAVVAPVALPGPHPVACSNIAQDFTRVGPGESAPDYWRGAPRDGGGDRYVTDLVAEPEGAIAVSYTLADDGDLYAGFRGRTVSDVALLCYPTTPQNTRADYALPGGGVVPKMQRGVEAPILPPGGPWPALVYSHGYAGSPLDDAYLPGLIALASHGYVVAAVFHGDLRWSRLGFGSIDAQDLLGLDGFDDFVAMQAIRPASASALLDRLAAHPHWQQAIDLSRVGGFGVSQGGETLMLMGGAELTTSVFQDSKRVRVEPRLVAAVGYLPYFGLSFLPAFGRDQRGIDGVTLPYLAIGGTADDLARIERIEQGVRRLAGTRSVVAIDGLAHELDPQHKADVYTWALVFLDSQLRRDPAATAKLQRMASVADGATDERRIDYTAPLPAIGDERPVVEFHHADLDHYFVTAEPAEIAALDQGLLSGWSRTGFDFKALDAAAAAGEPNCRYFGVFGSVSTHFYSILANECALLAGISAWTYEADAFRAEPSVAQDCPPDRTRVVRIYNDGKGGAANHRYTTSASETATMVAAGWVVEGAVFCARP